MANQEQLVAEVTADIDLFDEAPDFVIITIDDALRERVRAMNHALKAVRANEIAEGSFACEWFSYPDAAELPGVDALRSAGKPYAATTESLRVRNSSIVFRAYAKHGGAATAFSSDQIAVSEILRGYAS